jgi:hypothetical protein
MTIILHPGNPMRRGPAWFKLGGDATFAGMNFMGARA